MASSSDPQKVKLLCSFGGKILPRPSDGALRYAGGHTRIFSLRRSSTLSDLFAKISHIANAPIAAIKYQLPDEDLDALISISSQEDLDNMFEEFDRICEIAPDGSARMRIFLLSPSDLVDPNPNEAVDTGQNYIDAVNGIGIKRNNSLVSTSSNEGMSSPSLLSPTAAAAAASMNQDSGRMLGFFGDETLISGRIETQQVQFLTPSVNVVNFSPTHPYVHPIYVNADNLKPNQGKVEPLMVGDDQLGTVGSNLKPNQGKVEPLMVGDDQLGTVGSNLKPNQGKVEGSACLEENSSRADQNSSNGGGNSYNKGLHHNHQQPLSQLPPLHPALVQNLPNSYVPPLRPIPQHMRLEDCQLCQKSLPHAHSDTLINEHPSGNGNGSGSSAVHEQRPVLQCHHSEDPMRLQASLRVENPVEPRVENEWMVHPNTEVLDHSKVLHPPTTGVTGEPVRMQAALRAVDAESEPKVETLPNGDQFGVYGVTQEVSHPLEKERLVHPNVETLDQAKVLQPHRAVPGALAESVMEPKVDKMAPSGQFGAYGLTQIPTMPRPHDNERLLINPHVSTVVGFPSDTHTSYGMFTHPSQWHPTDSFLPITQNMVPPSYLVKQDLGTKQFVSDVSSVKNGNFHATEPPSRISVPEVSHDYARPIDGMMEGLHVSTFESSGITEQHRPARANNLGFPVLKLENSTLIAENSHAPSVITEHQRPAPTVNLGVPMLKPENSTPIAESNHAIRPQAGGNAVFLGNGIIKSGIAPEGNSSRPMNQLPPSTTDLKPEHPSVASDNNQAFRVQVGRNPVYLGNAFTASGFYPDGNSVRPINLLLPPSSVMMANHGQLFPYTQEMRQAEVPDKRLLVMPSYSCGISPANNNNAVNMLNNVPASPRSKATIQYANSKVSNANIEQFQGTTPSDSLFCNHDPQKILGNMQMMPPMPNKVSSKEFIAPVSSKEFVAPKDLPAENHVVNNKGPDVAVLLEEGGIHQLNSTNKDVCTEPFCFIQGEELNKQEVQALSEQVVTSVLPPSVPPATVSFPHERKEADLPSTKGSGLGESNVLSQVAVAAVGEGIMTKQTDKVNFGFPVTDDIGHLQIIKNGDLEELRELGSGTFGTVFHGKWRGSDVAIKRINDRCFAAKPSEEERMRADFWNEACMLADLHHPNVVAFYGVVLDGPGRSFATVTEFMVNGSLRRALQKNDKILDKRKRLLIAMDVAFGMEYLHGKNLIHFDLKSDNLLVNLRDPQRPICKVADLGLSKVKCQTLISGGVRGTLPWMAPELLNGGSNLVSEKVDVFSFGIVMWELITGEEPYADLHYGAIIGGIVSNTLRPPVPESCDAEWKSLMKQCWSAEPSDRPSFTEIASRLRSIAASLPQKA